MDGSELIYRVTFSMYDYEFGVCVCRYWNSTIWQLKTNLPRTDQAALPYNYHEYMVPMFKGSEMRRVHYDDPSYCSWSRDCKLSRLPCCGICHFLTMAETAKLLREKHTKYFRRMLQVIPGQYASLDTHRSVDNQSSQRSQVRVKGGGQSRRVRGEGGGGGRLNPVKVKLSQKLSPFHWSESFTPVKGREFLRQWKEESIGNLLIVTRIEWAKGNVCVYFFCVLVRAYNFIMYNTQFTVC